LHCWMCAVLLAFWGYMLSLSSHTNVHALMQTQTHSGLPINRGLIILGLCLENWLHGTAGGRSSPRQNENLEICGALYARRSLRGPDKFLYLHFLKSGIYIFGFAVNEGLKL
jgi:hypothetical protein